jgi:predicted DNA-binding transcriptional regulator YafY
MRTTKHETELEMVLNIHRAISRKQPVTVTYVDEHGNETVRTVEPYSIRQTKAGELTLVVMCRLRHDRRTLRLDRVTHYTVHRGTFQLELPAPADPDEITDWWSIKSKTGHEIIQVELNTDGLNHPFGKVLGKARAESGQVRAVCKAEGGVAIRRLRRRDVLALQ